MIYLKRKPSHLFRLLCLALIVVGALVFGVNAEEPDRGIRGLIRGGWFVPEVGAQKADPETILVMNVRLFDRTGNADDKTVNILIKKQRLKLVTQDSISVEDADFTVDAQGGILMGSLDVGELANFLILDQDPRQTFGTLLDTNNHTSFAINDGKIVRNQLPTPSGDQPGVPRRAKWVAYTPPPFALPTSYQDPTKWNHWKTKYVNGAFIASILLDRMAWGDQDAASEGQVGDLDDYDGGDIRALRFGAVGSFNFQNPWIYTLFITSSAFDQGYDSSQSDSLSIGDARLDIPLYSDLSVSVGKQKEPMSMERLMGLIYLPMAERASVSDGLLPARSIGVLMSGTALERRMTWAGGAFNNWLEESGSISDNDTSFSGRITGVPYAAEDDSHLIHLGLGLRHTEVNNTVQYRARPEFQHAPFFVDTGLLQADSTQIYNVEAAWRVGPAMLSGEYMYNDVSAADDGDYQFSGYHATLSWVVTGEMRAYNRRNGVFRPVPIAQAVTHGGWGTWEASVRYSNIDLTDALDGGEMDIYSLGLNTFLTSTMSVSMNYRHSVLDKGGTTGHANGFVFRVMLMLD